MTMNDTRKQLVRMCESIADELDRVSCYGFMTKDGDSYWNDALDVEYTLDCNGDYVGVVVTVAVGGPTIEIDTMRGEVVGTWGTDEVSAGFDGETCDAIFDYWGDVLECMRPTR